jgi:hypothetical protein
VVKNIGFVGRGKMTISNELRNLLLHTNGNYEVTSEQDVRYNSLAWALNEKNISYWPGGMVGYSWPENIGQDETLDSFIEFFEHHGYQRCSSSSYERKYQKIAIYADNNGQPKHVSRQKNKKIWASKILKYEDIEHRLDAISGQNFGNAVVYLKIRKREQKSLQNTLKLLKIFLSSKLRRFFFRIQR